METFALDPGQWTMGRVFSTNPLVRLTDRVETLTVMCALMVWLLAVPFAAVAAATVYEADRHMYAEQTRTRHPVPAAVAEKRTGVTDMTVAPAGRGSLLLRSRPPGTAETDWVDDAGNRVSPPTPLSRARSEAGSVALSIVLGAGAAMTALVAATRWRLNRARDAQWDRALQSLFDGKGGAR